MIRLRHVLHPVRSTQSLYRRAWGYASSRMAARKFRDIRRGQRERCWCGGPLLPFKWHPSYGVCVECGCYVNRRPPAAEELGRLYSFDLYWHTRQQLKGHGTIEQRPGIDRSDGRMEYWLRLIGRYAPSAGRVVEVGCAHGVLLAELKGRGHQCIGLEPDERTAEWTKQNMDLDVRTGFFPGVDLPECDLFLAFDVIEHAYDPLAFLRGVGEVLDLGGVAILQTPIDRYQCFDRPFGSMFEKVFDDLEHQFVFVDKAIQRLTTAAGFRVLAQDQWRVAHEVVVLGRTG